MKIEIDKESRDALKRASDINVEFQDFRAEIVESVPLVSSTQAEERMNNKTEVFIRPGEGQDAIFCAINYEEDRVVVTGSCIPSDGDFLEVLYPAHLTTVGDMKAYDIGKRILAHLIARHQACAQKASI